MPRDETLAEPGTW